MAAEASYAQRVNRAQELSRSPSRRLSPSAKSSRQLASPRQPPPPPLPTLTFHQLEPRASTSAYVYPEPPSPTSKRFEAVAKRFGLDTPKATVTTGGGKGKTRREQGMPYITPPLSCQSTVPGLAEPFDSPATVTVTATVPPPRPPRAASRQGSVAAPTLADSTPCLPPLPSRSTSPNPNKTPTMPGALESAFETPVSMTTTAEVDEEEDQWQRERRLSSLFNGMGLGLTAVEDDEEETGTASEDVYEDAEEGEPSDHSLAFAYEPLRTEEERIVPAQQLLRQSWKANDDFIFRQSIDLVRPRMPRRIATMPNLSSLPAQPVNFPLTPSTESTRTDETPKAKVAESVTEEDDAQSCSATADVLDDYAASPEPPLDHRSRRESTPAEVSVAAVRSWLPTLQPVELPLASPTPSFSSSDRSNGFDQTSGDSSRSGSRTSWHSSEMADDEAGHLPTPFPLPAPSKRKIGQLFKIDIHTSSSARIQTVSTGTGGEEAAATAHTRPRRRRAATESAVFTGKRERARPVRFETKSAMQTPTIGSSPFVHPTWRSALGEETYDTLLGVHGQMEMRRQEVIAELCSTEVSFVSGLRGVVRVFLQPLRTPTGAWIRGVPAPVGRLFDWLEDIVYLHGQIVDALAYRQAEQSPLILRIADVLLDFIPRLEVHQPYLVRFETVTQAIETMAANEGSDFGEFVRMQQALPECGNMSLSSFLLKPVQRLMKYPLFFKQLCDLTPPSHPDHLASLSLLHSTDTLIRVMQEVKAREEEYSSVKALAGQIRNLPPGFALARRDRRLLAHGLLRRIHLSSKGAAGIAPPSPPSPSNLSSRLMPLTSPDASRRTSAISDSASMDSWAPSTPKFRLRPKETPLHAFVFSDIILFATYQPEGGKSKKTATAGSGSYKLVDQIGLGRVLGVMDLSGRTDHEHLIELSVLPIAGDESLAHLARACSSPAALYLTLAPSPSTVAPASRIKDRQRWVGAFEHSLHNTLRALAAPQAPLVNKPSRESLRVPLSSSISSTFTNISSASSAAVAQEGERWSVASTLAAGLPLPRSPSQQLSKRVSSSQPENEQGEREERGWWHGRLKAVRREVVQEPSSTTSKMMVKREEEVLRRAVEGVVVMARKPSRERV